MVRLLLAGLARTVPIALGLTLAVALLLILFRDNSFVEAFRNAAYIVGLLLIVFATVSPAVGSNYISTFWGKTYTR